MKDFDVFLSHSSDDKEWVIKLKADLVYSGLKVWLDKDEIPPGARICDFLETALEQCKTVIMVISPKAMASEWVIEEYNRALSLCTEKKIIVIPVIIKNAEMPGFLKNRKFVNFQDNKSYKENIAELFWGITGRKLTQTIFNNQLPIRQELTICFIGKTGSGKSTLINALFNWCLGVDGEEKIERLYCISTRSPGGEILHAEDRFLHLNTEDTNRKKGASSTKFTSKYSFENDENILHIVDTPGFADTSGIEKDRDHLKEILGEITRLNEVNIFGIVWNEKRLTAEQKFVVGCLKEMLPKDHYKNLVICVTNTLILDPDTEESIHAAGLGECPIICFDNLWVVAQWNRVSKMYRREADESFAELIQCANSAQPISSELFQSISRKKRELESDRIQVFAKIKTLDNEKKSLKKVIRELDDLSKDIKNIVVKRTRITAIETPAQWNTFCTVCLTNCHINCSLSFKTNDLSGCAAMDSSGSCEKCNHRHTLHTHECTKMEREEIKEVITDNENLSKKLNLEQDKHQREIIKERLNKKIMGLDDEIDNSIKRLRLIVDDLSALVMTPFNPRYLEYLETLIEVAKEGGDVDIANKMEKEINNYRTFIKLIKSGADRARSKFNSIANRVIG